LLLESKSPRVYGVSELTEAIGQALEDHFAFIWVEGEISNFSAPVSGHFYMSLKDAKSQIRAVMFRMQARNLRFTPDNGMKVIAQGRIGIYPPRGEYQFILDYLEPMGFGALALAFEQLKKKLAAEGLFDERLKKPLPFLPQRVAVITSPTGAAVRDFLKVIFRRFANMEIIVVPVRVQGEGACTDIVRALQLVNRCLKADVIVLTRGGGSLEDLWAFNQEDLAVAIRCSNIPVVSAVGHEIDWTISDLASDFRAPTPSAAAELLVAEKELLRNRLDGLGHRLVSCMRMGLKNSKTSLDRLAGRISDPRKRFSENWMRLDEIRFRLSRSILTAVQGGRRRLTGERRALLFHSPARGVSSRIRVLAFYRRSLQVSANNLLREKGMILSSVEEKMAALNPLSILKRGYSISRKVPGGEVLKDVSEVEAGDRIHVLLARGAMRCLIEKTEVGEG
jgi:exodeoxyribonuclease VII large subunit